MAKVKYNLSRKIPTQIDQGKNAAIMSAEVMSGGDPLITALDTANNDLESKHATVMETRQALNEAYSALRDSALAQRTAFNNLGGLVQTNSEGEATYILSCGYGVRSNGTPLPPVEEAPSDLRTRVNGVSGRVLLSWSPPSGARFFEAQSTSDLSGATGWTEAPEMPSKTKIAFEGLTSGTKYAFRVRAWGNGMPGPWSSPIQQMAP